MSTVISGTCRHCGCTEDNACTLPTNDPCCWVTGDRTVCSNPACIKAEAQRVEGIAKARRPYAGWGYGAIVADLRRKARRGRNHSRGKGRAA